MQKKLNKKRKNIEEIVKNEEIQKNIKKNVQGYWKKHIKHIYKY